MKKRLAVIIAGLAALGGVSSLLLTMGSASVKREPLNVVMVSLDTLRANHLGCYGYDRPTSPSIDRLASQGVLFEQAIAQSSWTLPSHMSLLTGLYPSTHGAVGDRKALPQAVETLQMLFQEAGYRTEGVVSSPYVGSAFRFHKGFDDFLMPPKPIPDNSKRITAEAIERLQRLSEGKQPFFLFLHYLASHTPYDPPPPFDTMFDPDYTGTINGSGPTIYRYMPSSNPLPERDLQHIIALYDGEIAHVDTFMDVLCRELVKLKLDQNTLFILLSDHGEEFKDHGSMDHGRSLYEEVIRVPLILVCPGTLPAGRRFEQPVQLIDIMPTLCDLLGLRKPDSLQGESFLPLLKGGLLARAKYHAPRYIFSEVTKEKSRPSTLRCIRGVDGKKLILTSEPSKRVEVYDLTQDALEKKDLSNQQPGLVKVLNEELADWQLTAIKAAQQGETVRLSAEQTSILKDLGYLGSAPEEKKDSARAPDTQGGTAGESAFTTSDVDPPGFKEPRGISLGPDGSLYVSDFRHHRIQILDTSLHAMRVMGGPHKGEPLGMFNDPCAVVADPNGVLYVADTMNNRVQVLGPEGSVKMVWENLVVPRGIAISADGKTLYVTQTPLGQIVVIGSEGIVVGTWGSQGNQPGQLAKPTGLAVDAQGGVWVADWGNARVQMFDSQGQSKKLWTVSGWEKESLGSEPYIAISPAGDVIASDPAGNRLLRYSKEGALLGVATQSEGIPLKKPSGVACLSEGVVVVSDTGNNAIKKIKMEEFVKP